MRCSRSRSRTRRTAVLRDSQMHDDRRAKTAPERFYSKLKYVRIPYHLVAYSFHSPYRDTTARKSIAMCGNALTLYLTASRYPPASLSEITGWSPPLLPRV